MNGPTFYVHSTANFEWSLKCRNPDDILTTDDQIFVISVAVPVPLTPSEL